MVLYDLCGKSSAKVAKIIELTIFIPKYFIDLVAYVVKTCKNKQIVAQPVDKPEEIGVDRCRVSQCDDAAFGSAGYSAAHVGHCRYASATGQDEAA